MAAEGDGTARDGVVDTPDDHDVEPEVRVGR